MDLRIPIPLALRVFDAMFLPWMRRRISAVHITGLPKIIASDRPLIIASNHVSWWDAFLLREIHRILRPAAPLYTVMLEHELNERPLLRLLGATGIDPGSPSSVARCLRLLKGKLEQHPESVVIYFPQGQMWPSSRRPLGFQRGIEVFARHLPAADVMPASIHLEPLNSPSPHAFVAASELMPSGELTASGLEAAVEQNLDDIHDLLSTHGERAPGHWPPLHGGFSARTQAQSPIRAAK